MRLLVTQINDYWVLRIRIRFYAIGGTLVIAVYLENKEKYYKPSISFYLGSLCVSKYLCLQFWDKPTFVCITRPKRPIDAIHAAGVTDKI